MNDSAENARAITAALGGHWRGGYGTAPCPICQPERRKGQNALTLHDASDGRLLLHCKKAECDFRDILAAAGVRSERLASPDAATLAQREAEKRAELEKRSRQARAVWEESRPIYDSLAERYLRGRGITCTLPPTLRFHPECWHASARRLPALVALVIGGDGFAVHRTYLRPDGCGKAEVEPDKAMLGATAGGAVRLSRGAGRLVVAEGIETALSLRSGLLEGQPAVWAALSTSGLRGLRLPPRAGRLTIAPDGDPAGRDAAHSLAERAHGLGWKLGILDPGDGADFNDILTGEVSAV